MLFTIDPEPYRIALDQAEAALATARVNVEQLRVAYGRRRRKLKAAKETLAIRQAEFDRKKALAEQGVTSDSTLDDIKLALQQAADRRDAGQAAGLASRPLRSAAIREIATEDHPAVLAAHGGARHRRSATSSKTTVIAPAAGIVSQVASLNVGQFVAAGTTIASLVETDETWIAANFKETQLGDDADRPAGRGQDRRLSRA